MYFTGVSLILISLFAIGFAVLTVLYASYDQSKWPNDYALVIDAGSSGTRAYLYEWKADFSVARGDDLVVIEKSNCKAKDKGIDKLTSKAEFIEKISPCINELQKLIPESRMKRAYIFLAATAGMRLLEARDKTASDEIFGYIREYFKETDFLFKNDSQVRILTGQEEGNNAWISANYFQDNFKNKDPVIAKTSDTNGILDLGGASTQIVFVPEDTSIPYPSFFGNIRIYGVNYRPYSYSFLCWGQNEIALLYQTYLITKGSYSEKTTSGCYPKDWVKSLDSNDILRSPCANGIITGAELEFTAHPEKIRNDSTYEFEGQSNQATCNAEVSNLFKKSNCNYGSCSFNGVYIPKIDKSNIMGFSGFYYAILNTESLFGQTVRKDFQLFKKLTSELCSMSYTQLNELNENSGADLPEKFLLNQCFTNVYISEILTSYGLTSFEELTITDKVNGNSLNWALGYLINELNRDDFLPYEIPPRKLSLKVYLPLAILSAVVIISVVLALIVYKIKKVRSQRTPEEALTTLKNDTDNEPDRA